MPNLFHESDRQAILGRLDRLEAGASRQWGKMSPAQMLAHCAVGLESACGVRPVKQTLLGKLLAPLARGMVLGPRPFWRGSPTDPSFVVSDERDFVSERDRVLGLIDRLAASGPAAAGRFEHVFFGKLSGEDWGLLMYKHLDHHLRQFGV